MRGEGTGAHTGARRAGGGNNWAQRCTGLRLSATGSQTKLSHVNAVEFSDQRASRFYARCRALPLQSVLAVASGESHTHENVSRIAPSLRDRCDLCTSGESSGIVGWAVRRDIGFCEKRERE
jgi:hypothetical protein